MGENDTYSSEDLSGVLVHNVRFTDDMLNTLFCEVENIINGRPMTKLSDDVNDGLPLTPNHLLMMRSGANNIRQPFNRGDMYRKQWRYVQHMTDIFWKKWIRLYLPNLQQRKRWLNLIRSIQVGDLVMIADEITPRNVWPMGLILEVMKGMDGLVRSARVKTASTVLVRPITKMILLEYVDH